MNRHMNHRKSNLLLKNPPDFFPEKCFENTFPVDVWYRMRFVMSPSCFFSVFFVDLRASIFAHCARARYFLSLSVHPSDGTSVRLSFHRVNLNSRRPYLVGRWDCLVRRTKTSEYPCFTPWSVANRVTLSSPVSSSKSLQHVHFRHAIVRSRFGRFSVWFWCLLLFIFLNVVNFAWLPFYIELSPRT